jgi:nicotinamidase-related amidase
LELLTAKNSVLVLVDYQPLMLRSVGSGDKTIIKSVALHAAKAARILRVVLSSINPKFNGDFFREIAGLFPDQDVFARRVPKL